MSTTRSSNQRSLEKVTTNDFVGSGALTEEEFQEFFEEVQNETDLLNRVRTVDVNSPTGDIPKIGVGERLLQAVNEGSRSTLQNINTGIIEFNTTKVGLPFELTRETVEDVIGGQAVAGTIREHFARQFAVDTADLAMNGDEAADDGTSPTADELFRGINDGWFKIADTKGAPTYSHTDGSGTPQPVSKSLFHNMIQQLDQKYKRQNNLVFMLGLSQVEAYKNQLTDRSTAAGDEMLMTDGEPTPYGYDIMSPPNFPANRAMLVNPDNLLYVLQRDMEVRQTQDGEEVIARDLYAIYNMLSRLDFEIEDENAMVVADGIA